MTPTLPRRCPKSRARGVSLVSTLGRGRLDPEMDDVAEESPTLLLEV